MIKTVIETVMSVAGFLVLWLAPPSWKPLAYVLIVGAVVVALIAYVDSRRRLKAATAAVDDAKSRLEELRKK